MPERSYRPHVEPRCRACGQVDTLPCWQWYGRTADIRIRDHLRGGVYAERMPGYASPTARRFYRDRHGDAYITQCAGCLLAARLRDVLVTRPPLEELQSALQLAFEAYVRRQIERIPPPPVDETPGTSASNPPPPPPLVSQQRDEFFGR